MKSSFTKWLAVSAVVGLIVPLGFLLLEKLVSGNQQSMGVYGYGLQRAMRVIWPSSIWLMATVTIEGTPKDYLFILMSVAANVFLYSSLGSLLWCLKLIAHGRHAIRKD